MGGPAKHPTFPDEMPSMNAEPPTSPRVLLVIGHGRQTSFCHHLLQLVQQQLGAAGAELRTHDLLADEFDPVLHLEEGQLHAGRVDPLYDPLTATYQADVLWADAYVIVHPVWWFAPPAILKGWVDRVLVDDVALKQSDDGGPPTGLLTDRRALVVQTFNADRMVDKIVFGAMAKRFWRQSVFLPVGIKKAGYHPVYSVGTLNVTQRERVEDRLRRTVTAFWKTLQAK
jgi:NAD(P)H dehydrogenase (quinone)